MDDWIPSLLAELPAEPFAAVRDDPERFRLQILVTELIPAPKDQPDATETRIEHGFRVDAEFFYPASAIKTYAAVSTLRLVRKLRRKGVNLDTPVAFCKAYSGPCEDFEDESNLEEGLITLGHEIRKMHLVSDNRSFYRLYNILGHRGINEDAWAMGFDSFRAFHPYYVNRSADKARITPRAELRVPDRDKPVMIKRRKSDLEIPAIPVGGTGVGSQHKVKKEVADGPKSFATKNYVSLRDLHRLTLAIVRPDLPDSPDLGLMKAHRRFLRRAMTEDPQKSKNPSYPSRRWTEKRYKTMMRGLLEHIDRKDLEYVNKAGLAYGFHIENAYIRHKPSGRAFVVTVTIHVNANDIMGDNVYEYDEISRPFYVELGKVLAKRLLPPEEPAASEE